MHSGCAIRTFARFLAVAKENGIGLIFRATPGLTFVLDPTLDISPLVVQKLDALRSFADNVISKVG